MDDKNADGRNRPIKPGSNLISLAPLTPEQALLAAMNTKPPARKKTAKKPKK